MESSSTAKESVTSGTEGQTCFEIAINVVVVEKNLVLGLMFFC